MSDRYYQDENVFRTGSEPRFAAERLRFFDDGSVVLEIASWDAPDVSLRIKAATAKALGEWLLNATSATATPPAEGAA